MAQMTMRAIYKICQPLLISIILCICHTRRIAVPVPAATCLQRSHITQTLAGAYTQPPPTNHNLTRPDPPASPTTASIHWPSLLHPPLARNVPRAAARSASSICSISSPSRPMEELSGAVGAERLAVAVVLPMSICRVAVRLFQVRVAV